MANPVIAEVTRGGRVESIHRGRVVAVDADGAVLFRSGDVEGPVYPRSALKLMQALPLVESGAADALGLFDRELALACASHSSQPVHGIRCVEGAGIIGETLAASSRHPR